MDLLEIILLITGAVIIVVSSWLIRNPDKKAEANSNESNDNAIKRFSENLSTVSEDIISKTEEYLNRLSNEKIMAVSEYSDQILEKMDRNHEEVIFLYNMLTNKEKELKETLKELNDAQRKVRELLANIRNERDHENFMNASFKDYTGNIEEDHNNSHSVMKKNEEILNLYSQGMSVLEISKKLGVGQGEVKLIIDLFGK